MQPKTKQDQMADKIDDVGLGLLASPYIAKAVQGVANRVPALKPLGAAAGAYEHAFHANPYGEIAGLALVSPTVSHGLAEKLSFEQGAQAALRKLGMDDQMSEGGYTKQETRRLFEGKHVDLGEAQAGLNDELEHTGITQGSDVLTRAIVQDHLREDPKYYTHMRMR